MALVAVCGFRRSLGTGKSLSFVDAVEKSFQDFRRCHVNNSTSRNARYAPITERSMVK